MHIHFQVSMTKNVALVCEQPDKQTENCRTLCQDLIYKQYLMCVGADLLPSQRDPVGLQAGLGILVVIRNRILRRKRNGPECDHSFKILYPDPTEKKTESGSHSRKQLGSEYVLKIFILKSLLSI